MMFNPTAEAMPRADLRKLQGERLQQLVQRAYHNVPFYRAKLDAAGVKPGDIRRVEDIVKLPFTMKAEFRDQYPFGMFAVPQKDIVRIHASSGTTGKPTVVGYTKYDIEVWAECAARSLACGGATAEDIVQVAYGYGLFTGGLGMHYGAEKLGAATLPMSSGNTEKQIMLMKDFGVTVLCCTPSYALQVAEVAAQMGEDLMKLPLKSGHFGAEPWTEAMRHRIEELFPLKALDIYGLSEVAGPGVANECLEQNGLHVFEDHFLPEIINPDTGEPLPDGEKGELVFTCLTKEGVPLIRYRTRDITMILNEGTCRCGRTSRKIARLMGRTDDMLIIRGINVFPSQVEDVLVRIEGVHPQYLIVVDRQGNLDTIEIKVEVTEALFSDEVKKLEALRDRIQQQIRSVLSISAKITLVEPKTIERTLGKAKRVQDRRKLT
ncbi:MAG TPA: phenylacetate--CoA ligase [Kiritimatiellia bacterium]|jgi:phenylacetate-CoA ligase|nr:phenylacetate--CoA ligase [Kiritimatiellia bacterium]HOE36958.1 phenylacetate--CoA ligase [Kiritimatiellia bacterium]HOR74296.1 phenylacetate--CoA ligase [Kiritimatiellia bacterium]HOU59120.1 phenylacetate--CoA ligase [Kiritimatiellia bacterium]HPK69350.1 phenylacetate--CoA ligase [Kiritimatiellia bacterium]